MKIDLYQIDAFAEQVFQGNPAAVCPLQQWQSDASLQAIAAENNLSETAFFVPMEDGFALRWFTPSAEVDLCGHATLASAHVLFQHLDRDGNSLRFHTRSGVLTVCRSEDGYCMDFPASMPAPVEPPADLVAGLGRDPVEVHAAEDYLAVYASEADIRALDPDFARLRRLDRRGVIATAPGAVVDCVSRCFYPKLAVNEDPVTGSAHCQITPYWCARLGRNSLDARQLSRRGGALRCRLDGARVLLEGRCADYLVGEIELPDPL